MEWPQPKTCLMGACPARIRGLQIKNRVVSELKVGTDSIPSPQPLSRRERGFLYPLESYHYQKSNNP